MRLQRIIIPNSTECTELYHRGELSVAAGGTLTFDTYFNSFSYNKYRQYTSLESVTFSCRLTGRACVQLCVFDGAEQVFAQAEGEGEFSLSVKLSQLPEAGFLYPRLTALTDCRLLSGEYTTQQQGAPINVCIAICTYKREQYVLGNLVLLKSAELSHISRVFVIDNGNTLDAQALSEGIVTVLPNRNYGGSGGFTRGLIEAHDGGFSHVILMDDDIELQPEMLDRMTALASLLKEKHCAAHFATGMLSKNVPYIQYEMGGAVWDGKRVCGGRHDVDVRSPEALLSLLTDNDITYGAWWCFMMPVSDIGRYGLPFPFFIKIDDVEYGLRTCADAPIITMNGAAVRHEDFGNKYSMHLEYYNVRNQLVMNAAHGIKPLRNTLYRLFAVSFKHLALYRYDSIPMIMRAFDDFLKGVDFFISCDEEQLNREIMQAAPKLVLLADIPDWDESMRDIPRSVDNTVLTPLSLLTWGGHIVPWFLLKKDVGAAPLSCASFYDTFGRCRVIQYQLKGDTALVSRRSFAKFVKYSTLVALKAVKILFYCRKAARSYSEHKDDITSAEFWRNHLGLD